jgi:hypothetical protein
MLTNKEYIKNWLDEYEITNYNINEDLTVDVDGDVWIDNRNLTEIPVKFNIVKGDFNCNNNQLTSTEFFPKEVYCSFYCDCNNFKNLDNFPKIVTEWITIGRNPHLENIIGLWSCDYRGYQIYCDKKWKEEIEYYLISINRLKEVEIHVH